MGIRLLLAVFLLMSGIIHAQVLNPQKDLAFGQLAAGGGYETVIVVTNRGGGNYSGVMKLHKGEGIRWNPQINGQSVTNGTLNISLAAGETKTFKVTLPGATEAGFAVISAADMDQTSFIEGNLTFFIPSGGAGPVTGIVGVSPSSEFYRAVLAMDDLSNLAVALVNLNPASATVTLTAFGDDNERIGDPVTLPRLGSNHHLAEYLWQRIPNITGIRGRVEIESDRPIMGTALTFTDGFFASLPLSGSPYSYEFSTSISGVPLRGQLSIWAEGKYLKGYLRVISANNTQLNPPGTFLFHGVYAEGTMRASGAGRLAILGNVDLEVTAELTDFHPSDTTALGTIRIFANNQTVASPVTFTKIQ